MNQATTILTCSGQAAAAGVRRFVYLSSIKVNGEFTQEGRPFTVDDAPAPEAPYGVSKHEAGWSGNTRNWSPIGAVTLNPERDSVICNPQAENKIRLAA